MQQHNKIAYTKVVGDALQHVLRHQFGIPSCCLHALLQYQVQPKAQDYMECRPNWGVPAHLVSETKQSDHANQG